MGKFCRRCSRCAMGLHLGELGLWFVKTLKLNVDFRVIEMKDWRPTQRRDSAGRLARGSQ